MKLHCTPISLFAFAMLAGCASLREHDALCGEIVRFANTSIANDEHSVQFTTDWGGVFSTENDVFAEKHCEHGESEPARKLCGYLMENTSTEFAALNINRALRCIGAPEIPEPVRAELHHAAAEFESDNVSGVKKGVVVVIAYSYGFDYKPPMLRIYAKKS